VANDPNTPPQKGKQQDRAAHDPEWSEDERIEALMPWINRGQLEEEDRDLVNDGLASSPTFQADLSREAELTAALDAIAKDEAVRSEGDAEAAWAKFKSRLPQEKAAPTGTPARESASPQPQPQSRPQARTQNPARSSVWRRMRLPQTGVGWLAAAQTAALAALAFMVLPSQLEPQEDDYRLLSSADLKGPVRTGNAVVMFDPASDQAAVQALLLETGARIVDGPMENGGYVIAIDPDGLEDGLASLQASEAVILAEPLGAEVSP